MKANRRTGTLAKDIVLTLRKYGFSSRVYRNVSIKNLRRFYSRSSGVLLSVQSGREAHWVLLADIQTNHVVFMDPWHSPNSNIEMHYKTMSLRQFESKWSGNEGDRLAIIIE